MKEKDTEYFDLCVRLAAEIDNVHKNSRRYTKRTLWSLLLVPVFLLAVIFVTQTSKITVLFVWLAYMFMACGFLIFIEYTDHRLSSRVKAIMGGSERADMIHAEIEALRRNEAEEAERHRLEEEAREDMEAEAEHATPAPAQPEPAYEEIIESDTGSSPDDGPAPESEEPVVPDTAHEEYAVPAPAPSDEDTVDQDIADYTYDRTQAEPATPAPAQPEPAYEEIIEPDTGSSPDDGPAPESEEPVVPDTAHEENESPAPQDEPMVPEYLLDDALSSDAYTDMLALYFAKALNDIRSTAPDLSGNMEDGNEEVTE